MQSWKNLAAHVVGKENFGTFEEAKLLKIQYHLRECRCGLFQFWWFCKTADVTGLK